MESAGMFKLAFLHSYFLCLSLSQISFYFKTFALIMYQDEKCELKLDFLRNNGVFPNELSDAELYLWKIFTVI